MKAHNIMGFVWIIFAVFVFAYDYFSGEDNTVAFWGILVIANIYMSESFKEPSQ